MQSMNIDVNAAMDALKIPEDERETYIQILKQEYIIKMNFFIKRNTK